MSSEINKMMDLRNNAAIASGGKSNITIYQMIVTLIISLKLKGSVLDFGAGIGNFTNRLLELNRFSSITAIDIVARPEQLAKSVNWFSMDLNENIGIPDKLHDVIVAPEIIEHLENPRFISREWFRLLSPGGILIMSTPNNESLRSLIALILRGHYVAFGDSCYPAHITALLIKDIVRILQEAGFVNIRFYFSDHGGLPGYPKYTWQQISMNVLKGRLFSDNVFVVADKPL